MNMYNVIIICLLVTNVIGFGAVIYLLYILNETYRTMLSCHSTLWEPFFERLRNISQDEDAIYAHARDITELMYDIRDILKVTLKQKKGKRNES